MKILFATLTRHDEPLGIMYLSSVLKNSGHTVRGVMTEKEDIYKVVKDFNPDLIGFSVMGCEKHKILHLNRSLKKNNDFISVIGGPLATFTPDIIYDDDYIDAVCRGEGEEAMLEFVENLENGHDITRVPNFFVRVNGKVYKNEMKHTINNIDSIPFPDRTLFRDFKEGGLYNIVSSRGCPFDCSYCHNKKYNDLYSGLGTIVRFRSIINVVDELEEIKLNCKPIPSVFWFQEDIFYSNVRKIKEFSDEYKRRVDIPFICSLRPEILNKEEIVKALKEANCTAVFTGCEAGNDKIRQEILKRKISKEQLIRASVLAHKYELRINFQNMIGIPSGNFEHDLETLELNATARPYYAWASICTPYPGTELYQIAKDSGLLSDDYENELEETYHFRTNLKLPHANKVNILHKIFALATEYPELVPIVKKEEFYRNVDDERIRKLKKVFDSFKAYKYEGLYNNGTRVPDIVTEFVNQTLKSC